MQNHIRFIFIFCCFHFWVPLFGQTAIKLADCEKALQKNNFMVLAQQCHVSEARAAIIQAKIWPQPYVYGEANMYNPDQQKYFDVGPQGQTSLQIQQLFMLGGKKRNEINWAKANAQVTELEFEQLLYQLNFGLKSNFYNLYFDQQVLGSLQKQIDQIEELVAAYAVQAEKGNVALKELVRLESLLLNMKNDRIEVQKNILEYQQNLAVLTGLPAPLVPQLDNEKDWVMHYSIQKFDTQTLFETALNQNPEYRMLKQQIEAQKINLKWQQSLSVPDVTLGVSYDQRGGAFNNQKNLTLGIPIPLWNSNKGNIERAKAAIQGSQFDLDQKQRELQRAIDAALAEWNVQRTQFISIKPALILNRETVYTGVWQNFQKRNITLLEFTDFMDSYTQNSLQINESYKQLILTAEKLNYLVNSPLF
ncbi:MAG: transporter [Flavobacterium sp. BFFFF2]|nr:MAG: transporter [Flavobacterium sp. BFFFF2]